MKSYESHTCLKEIYSLRGSEFLAKPVQDYFKEKKIYYAMKFGKNKANFVENKIRIVKRLLYMQLRDRLSQNWPSLLPEIVKNYNNTPLEHLGYLCPNDIKNEADSMKVQEALKLKGISTYSAPSYQAQMANQDKYLLEKNSFKVGDYVYVDVQEKLFDKSFDIKVLYRSFIAQFILHEYIVFFSLQLLFVYFSFLPFRILISFSLSLSFLFLSLLFFPSLFFLPFFSFP